ncbi:LOB domain-containing protein 40-like isoform X3 [Gastrolobium bilobum]|uniref:LOB domain-containing protein 40-like isoform X3 n=1 Tax=Gastrolobium bilobum TaxID=150636 RepID=UPI002AB317D3|nr:LOB domain-containing protein 40-like isoform X3 [Gastrolobium bilobum]
MRMSCNGCRVLRKGCSENCSIRPCLQWIKSPESQANATVFLAKFYGRAGLMNLVNAGPEHLRPAIFRSLLYEACGRIVNPIYGSVGLLWSGSWQLCQAAVEAVLRGAPITPITSEAAASGRGPPLKAYDIRHVSKDENSAAGWTGCCATEEVLNRSASHESSLSHQSEAANSGERTDEIGDHVGLELTLGFEPASRAHHVVPVKKRRIGLNHYGGSAENESCKMELRLEYPA